MYLSDLLIKNPKSSTGYSQIDHVIITPYGLFVIETKNYQGTIYGSKDRSTWLINGKFKMMNPLTQNYGQIQALKSFIETKYHPYFISVVSFTKRCTFKIEEELRKINSNELVIYDIEKEDSVPREHKSALKKAEQYAKTMHMSKEGIYDQLTSEYGENFPKEAAQYAIDNIEFDWKANALEKAKSYAESMDMSDSAIYDQLVSEYGEKFTAEEAQYAVDNLE